MRHRNVLQKKKNVSGNPHTLPYVFTLEQWHSTRISLLIDNFFFFIIVSHSLAFYLKSFPTQVLQELIELNQETRTRTLFYPN